MKYVRQFLVILVFSFLGEILKEIIPLPIPASIYGLLLLFVSLQMRIVKLEAIADTGKFLIEIMPFMFIPAGAGLIDAWGVLKPVCVPVLFITLTSTVLVMAVSGRVTQFVIRRKKGEKEA
ncbi:MAG: CidA/LrgA family protein [Roseburia sp.]